MMEWIRFVIGAMLLLAGLVIFIIEVWGVFHFKYALNRMHVAAMGDTLGIGCSLLGLMFLGGFHFVTLKMILVICFFWITSPVCSHMLSSLEVMTNENLKDHCKIVEDISLLEEAEGKEEEK